MTTLFPVFALILFASSLCISAELTADVPTRRPLDYVIVVTGTELLQGAYADGHTPFLTSTLRMIGGRCRGSLIVDDDREEILRALRFATNHAPVAIVTGGLGPTPNDITRDVLAEFTGIALREHPAVLAEMERRRATPREELAANLRRQARVPVRGGYLENPLGTAVGLVFDLDERLIVALPGPPKELRPMVTDKLVPLLRERFAERPPGASASFRFVGIGQSQIMHTIEEQFRLRPDVVVTSAFDAGRVDFTFSLPEDGADARAHLEALKAAVRARLGDHLYAEDASSLEDVVVKGISALGGRLVLVEIGSGGHLAAALSDARDAASWLAAAYMAPNESAMERVIGIASGERAAAAANREGITRLANAAAKLTSARWVIAVGEVRWSSDRRSQVWVAFGEADASLELRELSFDSAPAELTTPVLDLLRRKLRD